MTDPVYIKVKVNAGAKSEGVRRLAKDFYQVRTRAPATRGKANLRVHELLATALGLRPERLELIAGRSSSLKRFRIRGDS